MNSMRVFVSSYVTESKWSTRLKTTTFEQKGEICSIRTSSSTSLFMADMNNQYQRCQGTYSTSEPFLWSSKQLLTVSENRLPDWKRPAILEWQKAGTNILHSVTCLAEHLEYFIIWFFKFYKLFVWTWPLWSKLVRYLDLLFFLLAHSGGFVGSQWGQYIVVGKP